MTTTYLVTGSNRGIGLELVKSLALRSNTTVVAAVRDPENASSKKLASLPLGSGSKLIVVKIDSLSDTDAKDAVEYIKTQGVSQLDVVIANSGIASSALAKDVGIANVRENLSVNTVGPLILFQATWPLLQKAEKPKFVTLTSLAASIGGMDKLPMQSTAYGASKAAINYITRKIHLENPGLIAFPLSPGWVPTEMGNSFAVSHGLEKAPDSLEDNIAEILRRIDSATRESHGGKFVLHDGATGEW